MTELPAWRKAARLALFFLGFLVAGEGVMAYRSVTAGEAAIERAEAAFDRGDARESVRQARRAASFAVPGAPHVEQAYLRLVVVAQGAEALGRQDLARFAWEALREAAVSTSYFGATRPELARANQALARLEANTAPAPDRAALEAEILRRLSQPTGPSSIWLGVLGAGFVLTSLGLFWVGFRGLDLARRTRYRDLLAGLALVVIGAACWTLAAYQA